MTQQKLPQNSSTYDVMFSEGGHDDVFRLPYRHSCYYPMFRRVEHLLRRSGSRSVLEVGCGTGALAHLLLDTGRYSYKGFGFSIEAVKQASERTGRPDLFFACDARSPDAYAMAFDYDTIVCTEVLEHVDQDLDVIALWPAGRRMIATVPNFDSRYHVRFFRSPEEVAARYAPALDIERIETVKKPYSTNLSLRQRWREIRWARYKPKLLLKLLGFGRIDDVGCWFVVAGRTRNQGPKSVS